jgi:hypothetical protein
MQGLIFSGLLINQDEGSEEGSAVQALAPIRARALGHQTLPHCRGSHPPVGAAAWTTGSH